MFVIVRHFYFSLIFAGKAGSLPLAEPIKGLHSEGRSLALPTNIRPGRKVMTVINTLAYYDNVLILTLKFQCRGASNACGAVPA